MTPTARTLAECRKRGWRAQVVEQTIPHTFIKRDLFGCIDIIALDGKPGVLGIQATTGGTGGMMARRTQKIHGECYEAAYEWLGAGNRLEVWGWAKQGARGKRKVWVLRVVPIERPPVAMFHGHPISAASLVEWVPDTGPTAVRARDLARLMGR